ncbi:hypothetical protein LC609_35965 [Nostoc sp. XA013]|nr:hypothetical protein [Nostoc sp. XA013]
MADKKDLAPEKVRLKDNYRERIFAESQKLALWGKYSEAVTRGKIG